MKSIALVGCKVFITVAVNTMSLYVEPWKQHTQGVDVGVGKVASCFLSIWKLKELRISIVQSSANTILNEEYNESMVSKIIPLPYVPYTTTTIFIVYRVSPTTMVGHRIKLTNCGPQLMGKPWKCMWQNTGNLTIHTSYSSRRAVTWSTTSLGLPRPDPAQGPRLRKVSQGYTLTRETIGLVVWERKSETSGLVVWERIGRTPHQRPPG